MSVPVTNIKLRTDPGFIRFDSEPTECEHAWEPHLWERARAYCPRCGSFADRVQPPPR